MVIDMAKYLIRPTNPARRESWQELLARDTLPVIDPRPDTGQSGSLVYHVDTASLTDRELSRLAGYVARQTAGNYLEAWELVNGAGVSIPALGCELLKAEETAVQRDLEDLWRGRHQR